MTNVEKRRWPHLWAVLVAALAPLLAIGFAFSLGPSPRKQLTQLDQRSETEARSLLSELGPHAVPALVEVLSATDTPHRVLVAERLGQLREGESADALIRVSRDEAAPCALRVAALHALHRVDASSAVHVARSLREGPVELRAEASRILGSARADAAALPPS